MSNESVRVLETTFLDECALLKEVSNLWSNVYGELGITSSTQLRVVSVGHR